MRGLEGDLDSAKGIKIIFSRFLDHIFPEARYFFEEVLLEITRSHIKDHEALELIHN